MALTKELGGHGGHATVIGPSILVSGKLSGDEDLTVQGRVEGELSLTKTLIVETSGVVKADVQVRNAIVSGVVVGNINASESVELTRDGRMVGDIKSPRVIIVEGASFRGHVDMGNAEPGKTSSERPRPVAVPTRTPPRPVAAQAPRPPSPPPSPGKKPEQKPAAQASKPPPPPPAPPVLASEAKKKLVVRKKGR